jgi:hypothetical protein
MNEYGAQVLRNEGGEGWRDSLEKQATNADLDCRSSSSSNNQKASDALVIRYSC